MSRKLLLTLGCIAFLAVTAQTKADPATAADPSLADATPPSPVPIVPLPPALLGAAASVAIATALRWSRHRQWIMLR